MGKRKRREGKGSKGPRREISIDDLDLINDVRHCVLAVDVHVATLVTASMDTRLDARFAVLLDAVESSAIAAMEAAERVRKALR